MGNKTGIEWTDHTFNPWIGCTAVSCACDHCYAEALVKRYGQDFAQRRRTSEANWKGPLKWDRGAKNSGVRRKVFCASLADVFDNQVPDEWRADLFELIRATPNLDWQLLTKRPQNIAKMLPADWGKGWPNLWLGTTVENQQEADRRIPLLLDTPASKRFLSCEPLLGPIDLTAVQAPRYVPEDHEIDWKFSCLTSGDYYWFGSAGGFISGGDGPFREHIIDWVIVGGESGRAARPMHLDWARTLRDQCSEFDVPFFFKQWGEWLPDEFCGELLTFDEVCPGEELHGYAYDEEIDCWRVGKKKAGGLLDGVEHRAFPDNA